MVSASDLSALRSPLSDSFLIVFQAGSRSLSIENTSSQYHGLARASALIRAAPPKHHPAALASNLSPTLFIALTLARFAVPTANAASNPRWLLNLVTRLFGSLTMAHLCFGFARHCFASRSSDALSRSPAALASQGARLLTT